MDMSQKELIKRAEILTDALPYFSHYVGETVIIKYGGNAMNDPAIFKTIMQDTAALKILGVHPILVHGGGPEIDTQLGRLNIASEFKKGLRVTTPDAMDVVQMTLAGKVNKNIVASLNTLGVRAVGLCGMDGNLIECERHVDKDGTHYGCVGNVTRINPSLLQALKADFIPVIATIGVGAKGEAYNINADLAAAAIGGALQAEKLLFLTNIDGIRKDPTNPSSLIKKVTVTETKSLVKKGIISGGMIPKVDACVSAIEAGVSNVIITNGTVPHAILLELFTSEGVGTMVTA